MDIRELPLHELVLDEDLNLRDRLDPETVERYVDTWDRMPPVTVFEVEGRWLLADGFHRHAAAVTLGRRTLPAEVRPGSFQDALDFVAGANLHHGLPLARAERRRAIEVKLGLHHERSDRHLAEELGVGRELIAKVRKQLVEAGRIPAGATRIGADGKTYPVTSLLRDPDEPLPRAGRSDEEAPRARAPRGGAAPWDAAAEPMPPGVDEGPPASSRRPTPPWEDDRADVRARAQSPPVAAAVPTIDEMLALMTQQIVDVLGWTQADGFSEAYRTAGASARGQFQTAAVKLAARADQLRKL